ncbi:fumarylacetoacetate hydrolase family protein [Microbacteriaceae bacterium K1510]|nr:fumarylacetoacetate hydrolase family protein [Microbacteriaceae bacterium K1510]
MTDRGYRLISYVDGGQPAAGVLIGEHIYKPESLLGSVKLREPSVLGMLRQWDEVHPALDKAAKAANPRDGKPLASVKLLAPILYPGVLFCAGANYWDHLEEMAEIAKRTTGVTPSMTKGAEPWFFMKTAAGSIIGPDTPARLPSFSKQVDWEAEVGVVIARKTRNISEDRAMEAVAGFVIVNDLSARDLMKREGTPFIYDWIGQKCFEDGAPMGPWFTPSAYVDNPQDMSIKLWVNGVLKQNSNTSRLVHNMAEQVAYLSRHVTLQPGDIIATGTPAGVGMPRGEFLKVGDEVRIEVEGCGTLTNRMIKDE